MAAMKKVFAGYEARQSVLTRSDNPFAKGVAWIEGTLVPVHEARIPLLDQGFLRSDLTYDVPSVWDGRFFRVDDHLERLDLSCKKIRLRLPLPREKIKSILVDMVARSGIRDAFVQLIVTRGLRQVRGAKPEELLNNNLYMFIIPYVWVMDPETQFKGGKAVVAQTVHRISPNSIDPTVKNLQWGDLTRGLFEAADRGAVYPFLTDGNANLTEGSGFNIFLVKDRVLYTADRGVLEGVTRKSIFEIAKAMDVEVRVQIVPISLAYEADEIFMCTTAGGIMPITELDDRPVKDGTIGPITSHIWDEYWEMHYNPKYILEVQFPRSAATPLAKL